MKVKVLSRNPDDYIRETKLDVHRVPRNYDPTLHPFEVCREYTQALNATKLERVFAKPFIGSLDGHRDGVNCLAKHTKSLSTLLSGSCDGEVKVWNLTKRECVRTLQAHEGFVRGLVVRFCGTSFFSVGDDKTVKQWKMEAPGYGEQEEPVNTILGKTVFTGLDHHQTNGMFATCGQQVDIWDEQRSSPIRSFTWGVDSFSSVRFNPVEVRCSSMCVAAACGRGCRVSDVSPEVKRCPTRLIPVPAPAHNRTSNPGVCAPASEVWRVSTSPVTLYHGPVTELLASCASDRSIVLYDMRESAPLKKVIMTMRSNTLCWNPMEAYYFTSSNEDYNLYTYDMRYLKEPVTMHMDHVSAVLDVDYSPTGREFVTASFDKTIRIFAKDQTHSREVYHTKRMQHVICVKWSADNKYILSGSDEMNIRIWKANAAEKLGVMLHRERASANYNQRLKEKFQHHPKIKRIAQHRHLPKSVYQEARQQKIMRQASSRKERNVRKHSKPGSVPVRSEKQKHVVAEVK